MRHSGRLLVYCLLLAPLAVGGCWVFSRDLMTGEFHTRHGHVIGRSADPIAYWLYAALFGLAIFGCARLALASLYSLLETRSGARAIDRRRRRRLS
jgi:hypothetical protein